MIFQAAQRFSEAYSHMPSFRVAGIGVFFGVGRIFVARGLTSTFSIETSGSMPPLSPLGLTLTAVQSVVLRPMLEEYFFRGDMNRPSLREIVKNSLFFGAMHCLTPAPTKVTRLFMATVGGAFYCGARVAGNDLWASTIAHSIYNLHCFTTSLPE